MFQILHILLKEDEGRYMEMEGEKIEVREGHQSGCHISYGTTYLKKNTGFRKCNSQKLVFFINL